MVLETIYIVRHGFRSTYTVDPKTGIYTSAIRNPTGIPTDPPLTSYGVAQSYQLAKHVLNLDPPVARVYTSPFYRCVQTIAPTVERLRETRKMPGGNAGQIRGESGIGEWYGPAPFTHPSPPSPDVISALFPPASTDLSTPQNLYSLNYTPLLVPPNTGETIHALHARVAMTFNRMISALDEEEGEPKAILICTHAATMIAAGRVLTGKKPPMWEEDDFAAWTCGLSTFVRRRTRGAQNHDRGHGEAGEAEIDNEARWEGTGVTGGWDCIVNGDCSFLDGGPERGW
ncbi:MAG: hypothetical protein M1837_000035 [Sclerophora amabilis]|nr:MAG: hypothetical protein M1837_000035 [Sclerophora amabilis]